jgi:hypothetical protein
MGYAAAGLKPVVLVMWAESINKVTRDVLFMLVTEADEQNSYYNNSDHTLIRNKGKL